MNSSSSETGKIRQSLLIVTEDSPGSYSPAGERIRHLAEASSPEFENVVVLSLRPPKKVNKGSKSASSVSYYSVNFSRAMPFPFDSFFDPVKMLVLWAHGFVAGRAAKPSYILASMPPLETGVAALLLSKLWNIKLVIDLRDNWESAVGTLLKRYFPMPLIQILSRIARKIYTAAFATFSVTQTILESLPKDRHRARLSLLVPNGADTNVFRYQRRKLQAEIRKKYGLPLDKAIVVYSGSGVNPYYRLDRVISSISLLSKDTIDRLFFAFYVYNGHSHLELLKQEFGISDNCMKVYNPLPRDELAQVLSACDIGLVPFDSEEYLKCARSTKIYEYLGSGLYVVSSGPVGGELDSFFAVHPDLGLFTLSHALNFAEALVQTTERTKNLFGDEARRVRYEFVRENYDRQRMMRKAFDALLGTTAESKKATTP